MSITGLGGHDGRTYLAFLFGFILTVQVATNHSRISEHESGTSCQHQKFNEKENCSHAVSSQRVGCEVTSARRVQAASFETPTNSQKTYCWLNTYPSYMINGDSRFAQRGNRTRVNYEFQTSAQSGRTAGSAGLRHVRRGGGNDTRSVQHNVSVTYMKARRRCANTAQRRTNSISNCQYTAHAPRN
ncbi:hypothetical protein B5X24_HaOG207293 [Helicoverpa armigera]|uniref:Secreted protein n=1 Tax=Helicoverpa armigera TaxID=29058 RepID=A0A2W1BPC1_HELAM|nr:hypothetical protein B5X24_HaOG207293 [Helicoverpa armigera]